MYGSYGLQVIPPASPASVGVYSLELRANHEFETIFQILQNTPEDRDWRSEWNASEGTFEVDGDRLKFTVTTSTWRVRSSAWNGRGIEREHDPNGLPKEAFVGVLTATGIQLSQLRGLELPKTQRVIGKRALIVPDYDILDL